MQKGDEYKLTNPTGSVPCLVIDGVALSQSLAIMEYLDEAYPEPPLLPKGDAAKRATVRKLCNVIACDIQPVQVINENNFENDFHFHSTS